MASRGWPRSLCLGPGLCLPEGPIWSPKCSLQAVNIPAVTESLGSRSCESWARRGAFGADQQPFAP